MGRFLVLLLAPAFAFAQAPCGATPAYSLCEIAFELNAAEAAAHPNPYATVQLHVEFRSPRHKTFLMPAYWDGGYKMMIRFSPVEPGEWDYRVTSNIARFDGQLGKFTATESDSPGFVRTANVHHFAYTEKMKPHLWVGEAFYRFPFVDQKEFDQTLESRAAVGVNHLSGIVIGGPQDSVRLFPAPDRVNPEAFAPIDARIRQVNAKGIVADLVLASGGNHLTNLFPTWQDRERYVRYIVARYSAMNVTWQGVKNFEEYTNGRELLKEVGGLLKKMDPYGHPRSTMASLTSSPLLADGWMDYVLYGSQDAQLGSVEHQLYPVPFVSQAVAGADEAAYRRALWNAAMNGQYAAAAGAGEGGKAVAATKAFTDFFAQTRHWELEPYFDVDGGRALALDGTEYIVYVEKAAPIEVLIERHNYDVRWYNPVNGEWLKQKDYKGEHFTGDPPDRSHDWVLHISREGRKEGMARSYKFESRPLAMQEVEVLARENSLRYRATHGRSDPHRPVNPLLGQNQARDARHP